MKFSAVQWGTLAAAIANGVTALSRKPSEATLSAEALALPDGPEQFPKEMQAAIASMQEFIKAAPEGEATLAMMGDSTMRTLGGYLYRLGGHADRVYTSNDGERKLAIRGDDGKEKLPLGKEWVSSAHKKHRHVKRAIAANKLLHSKGCNWGGQLELMLGRGPIEGLTVFYWGFIPEWSAQGCWQSCMADAVRVMDPRAMVWNVGLHTLNEKFDVETCEKRASHSENLCNDYEAMVTAGTKQLSDIVPTVIWKTTNYVCDSKLAGMGRVPLASEWTNKKTRPRLEAQCHKNCTAFGAEENCFDYLMHSQSSTRLYKASTRAVDAARGTSQSNIHVLNSFEPTSKCCEKDCDDSHDGLHYTGHTDAILMKDLAAILAKDEKSRARGSK